MELKNNLMTKQQRVEASIQTKGRFRDGSGKYVFVIYEEYSNATMHTSEVYTERSNARRGAKRYAVRNNLKISRWVL